MTLILGINAFHADAAAALIDDGQILAAAEEERFRRIKHWAGFPSEAIAWCLADAGVSLADVDHVAINSQPGARSRLPLATVAQQAGAGRSGGPAGRLVPARTDPGDAAFRRTSPGPPGLGLLRLPL